MVIICKFTWDTIYIEPNSQFMYIEEKKLRACVC